MAIDTGAYNRWKYSLLSSIDDERSRAGTSASEPGALPDSSTLVETASLLSERTSRGPCYTDNKSDFDYPSTISQSRGSRMIVVAASFTTMGSGAVLGIIFAPVTARSVLRVAGFDSGGIIKGSWAAMWQARIGNVTAGSLFSLAQAVAAGATLPAAWSAIAAMIGGLLGTWVCLVIFLIARSLRGGLSYGQ